MKFFLPILCFSVIFSSCFKNQQNPVPDLPFDVTIDINFPLYSELNGVGGWAYVDGYGSRGLIIYRKSIDEFVAFDRHSPTDTSGTCFHPLYPSSDNFLVLIDSCNNSSFSLFDGSPLTNSTIGLRQYQTLFDGFSLLRIRN